MNKFEVEHKKLVKDKLRKNVPVTADIINYYEVIPEKFLKRPDNPNYDIHNLEIPFRMCVCAPSGSGKTNFILNLLRVFSKPKGTFATITIITRNKDEPFYNFLESQSDEIIIKEGMHSTPDLDKYDKDESHLLIWDDLMLSKNLQKTEEYYIRARKFGVSLCFLAQSYSDIPKVIRKNSNYLILFDLGGSKREQNWILTEWSNDLSKEELQKIYLDATSDPLNPLIIQGGKSKDRNKKYRKSFLNYYNLDEFLNGVKQEVIEDKKEQKTKSKKKPLEI